MEVVCVQPVAIRRALFSVNYSLCMCVSFVSGCHAWVGICEYLPDVLFVHQGDVFFRLAECCVGECSKDIEAHGTASPLFLLVTVSNLIENCAF